MARLLKKYSEETKVNNQAMVDLTDIEIEVQSIKDDCKINPLYLKSS